MLNLVDDKPDIVEKLIQILYTRDYDDGKSRPDGEALITNIALYVAGDKFDVAALKTLAEKDESAVAVAWKSVSFIPSLRLLYAETPESDRLLKDVAIKAAASHAKELVKNNEFMKLCKENGEIGADVLEAHVLSDLAAEAAQSASAAQAFVPRGVCPGCLSSVASRPSQHRFYCGFCAPHFG